MARIPRRDYAALYGPTTGDSIRLGDTSLIAVVEHGNFVHPGAIRTNDVGVVLAVEPVDGIGPVLQREITLVPEMPDDVSGALSIVVINLQHPGLVPHGNYEGVVVWGIDYRVGMSPVGKTHRMAINVQVVESGP